MRRTFANVLRQKGINLKVIQELLGHNSLATTERYFSVTDDEKRSAVHDLEF
jgi:site-specific recombinase XerD